MSEISFGSGPWGCRCDRDPEVCFPWDVGKGSTILVEPEEITTPFSVGSYVHSLSLSMTIFGPPVPPEGVYSILVMNGGAGFFSLLDQPRTKRGIRFGTVPSECSSDRDSEVVFPLEEKEATTSVEPEVSSKNTYLEMNKVKPVTLGLGSFPPHLLRKGRLPYQHDSLSKKNKFSNKEFFFTLDENSPGIYDKIEKGTTSFGFIFRDWVFLAADHPLTSSTPKIVALTSHIVASISGGYEYLLEELREKCEKDIKKGERVTVEHASEWLAQEVAPLRQSVGMLIGGWDETLNRPLLYRVNCRGDVENCAEKNKKEICHWIWCRILHCLFRQQVW